MRRSDAIRLRHMLDAAEEAIGFVRGRTRQDLDHDRMLVLALMKDIEIIGEAAYQVTQETRQSLPEIPWEDILWATVQEDLPALLAILRKVLEES